MKSDLDVGLDNGRPQAATAAADNYEYKEEEEQCSKSLDGMRVGGGW